MECFLLLNIYRSFFLSFFFLVWTKGQLTNAHNKSVVQLDVAQAASPWLHQQSNSKDVLLMLHYWIQTQPDWMLTECFPDLVDFISHIHLGEKHFNRGRPFQTQVDRCALLTHSNWGRSDFFTVLIRLMRVFICCLIALVLISCFIAAMRGWNAMSDKWKQLVIELDERLGGNSILPGFRCTDAGSWWGQQHKKHSLESKIILFNVHAMWESGRDQPFLYDTSRQL